ncbi:hypothetical protein DSM43276_01324 [Mycobacteroides salmoniphilum]|nr:hypothetical protein DSM43276_01324 [Mycobacteroides salmoniphilum]
MPVSAVFRSTVVPLGDGPRHHVRYPHRYLVIASGTAVNLDRSRCGDPPHLVVQTISPQLHLMPAEGRRSGTIAGIAARRMSAAHVVILGAVGRFQNKRNSSESIPRMAS